MLNAKNNSLQFLLGLALTCMLVLHYYREASQARQIESAERALARLQSDIGDEQLVGSSEQKPEQLLSELRTSHNWKPSGQKSSPAASDQGRDLILYSYHETEGAAKNFVFFMTHALHAKADFIIIINGDHTQDLGAVSALPNVRIVERENRCFDLGGYNEVFQTDATLITRYKRFMFINDSLRGPFFPAWADKICWSDAYWDKLDERTRLVGMSWNCANGIPYPPHLQSMILAFTRETLQELLLPHMKCFEDMHSAVADGETAIAQRVMAAGYDVYAMESRFAAHAGDMRKNTTSFLEWCVDTPDTVGRGGDDILHTGNYLGSTLHPYETIFAKTNRDWDERDRKVIDILTEHADLMHYSSYDTCI
ncbi:hypothetical protein Slin15195_G121730 [Septoria linicola]|uniref:Uncharacterized protein n=1 Tax=Septoria linicola TaxID=215465 RepID=A0A9Q9B0W4_9PEZI|nr:hypothetical protein Slin14017_G098720 [Septoria linicola]USW58854.1 hypothetical protein Slin15195_G121730 [Septoria linicola]